MSRAFLTNVDLGQNELQNARVQNLGSPPAGAVKGQLYFNNSSNILFWYDGSGWVSAAGGGTGFPGFGSSVAQTTFGAAKADGVGSTTARADHVHGTPSLGTTSTTAAAGNHGHDLGADPGITGTLAIGKGGTGAASAGLNAYGVIYANSTATMASSGASVSGQLLQGQGNAIPTWVAPTPGLVGLGNVPNVNATNASNITTGTLPTAVLPPLAVNEVFVVASQAAMLALTAQRGDMAIRTDNGKTYVLSTDSPSTLADWKEVLATGQVVSVNGNTGVVVVDKASVGLGNVDNTADAAKPISTAEQTALNGKVDTTRNIATTAPLTGGGTLAADKTLAISNFTTTTAGAVPAPGTATGKVLTDAGTWAAQSGTVKSYNVGCAAATSTLVSHNLNNQNCVVSVYRATAPYDEVECDIEHTTNNTVTVRFAVAPTASQYTIAVIG